MKTKILLQFSMFVLIFSISLNLKGQVFTDVTSGSGLPSTGLVFWPIDFNNDNNIDFIWKDTSSTTYNLSLYMNNGNGTFSDVTFSNSFNIPDTFNNNFWVFDFNKDGFQDIVTWNIRNDSTYFYFYNTTT